MPPNEEHRRRVENIEQAGRVARVAHGDQLDTGLFQLFVLADGFLKGASAGDALRHGRRQAGRFELGRRGAENRSGGAEDADQLAGFAGAQAGNQPQCQPVELFVVLRNWLRNGLHSK